LVRIQQESYRPPIPFHHFTKETHFLISIKQYSIGFRMMRKPTSPAFYCIHLTFHKTVGLSLVMGFSYFKMYQSSGKILSQYNSPLLCLLQFWAGASWCRCLSWRSAACGICCCNRFEHIEVASFAFLVAINLFVQLSRSFTPFY